MADAEHAVVDGKEDSEEECARPSLRPVHGGVEQHAEDRPRANDEIFHPIENDQREGAPAPKQHPDDRNKVKQNCCDERPSL